MPSYWYYLYDHYRLAHILSTISRELNPGVYCHPVITLLRQYDEAHQSELVATLRAYLKCRLNMSAAADSLYIHRTSFCRRMDRIRELTAVDLEDADTILLLTLSLALEEL